MKFVPNPLNILLLFLMFPGKQVVFTKQSNNKQEKDNLRKAQKEKEGNCLRGLKVYFQVTFPAKIAMPNSQQFP